MTEAHAMTTPASAPTRTLDRRIALAAETAQVGVWSWDAATGVVEADARTRALFGWELDRELRFPGDPDERIHPDDVDEVRRAFFAALDPRSDGGYEAEYRVVHPDGTTRWVLGRGQVEFAGEGDRRAAVGVLGTALDLTTRRARDAERERLLDALASANRRLEFHANNSPLAIIEWNSDFEIVRWSEEAERLFGWSAEEVLHRPLVSGGFVYDEDQPQVARVVAGLLDGSSPRTVSTNRNWTKDGRLVECEWYNSGMVDDDGRLLSVYSEVLDVTARNRALRHSALLQETTAALAPSLDADEVATVVIDRILAAGDASGASLAVLDAEGTHLDLPTRHGLPEEWRERFGRIALDAPYPLPEAVRTGEPVFVESLEEARARWPEWVELFGAGGFRSAAAIPCAVDGRVIGGIAISWRDPRRFAHDERQLLCAIASQAAQALERARLLDAERLARAEAERANRAKSDFLATMSHELRTPLNAIQGYVQLLEMGLHGTITAEQRAVLARVQRAQRILLQHVDDVLNYARIEAGRVEYELCAESVGARLDEVVELLAAQYAARRLGLSVRVAPALPPARADRDKLRQILLNLLGNALKFTPTGGTITAEVVREDDAEGRGWILARIADTGIGIESDHLERIFEAFVQVNRSHRRPGEGTGLGLPISRELARGMGGDLTVASRPGEGSTFTLRLPVA